MNPTFQRGILLYQQNRYELAEAEFRQTLAGEPHNATAHGFLALCLTERQQFKEATEEATRVGNSCMKASRKKLSSIFVKR